MTSERLILLGLFIIAVIIDILYLHWKGKLHRQGKSFIGILQHAIRSFLPVGRDSKYPPSESRSKISVFISRWQPSHWSLPGVLFGLAIIIYLLCISIGLDRFPIYFFTDEAVHTNLAADFIHEGFENYQHEFLPTYFSLGPTFGLNGVSVYIQVIPYLLFGKSIFVTRFVSGLITLLGAIAVGLTLRDIFKIRHYWLGVLLLITSPAWFLHARTAFEYMELSAFYAGFIYFYLRYREGRPKALYTAVVLGALVFYTHGLGQMLIGTTAIILFMVDLRYHFDKNNRGVLVRAFILALVLTLPFVRFYLAHPQAIADEIRQRGSYWSDASLSLLDKSLHFGREYFYGLDPRYWYLPNDRDLMRHVMKGYGNLLWPMLPFAALGLGKSILNIKLAQYRTVLVALLVSPMPASLVAIGNTRVLWFIIPASIITALGLTACLNWLEQHLGVRQVIAGSVVFIILAIFSIFMLSDALTHGPTWYNDYTLYGLQFGGKQVFVDTIIPSLKQDPNVQYVVSPNWANGADQLLTFYVPAEYRQRVQYGTVDAYLARKTDFASETLFVMIPDEYGRAISSPIFKKVQVKQIINYPDGSPGFYILQLTYADNADQIIAAQQEAQSYVLEGQVMIDDQLAKILYNGVDAGQLTDMFDGNYFTLMRGAEANPFMLDVVFPEERTISGFVGDFATMDYTIIFVLFPTTGSSVRYEVTKTNVTTDAHVEVVFERGPARVRRIVINIINLLAGDKANIHIREVKFLP